MAKRAATWSPPLPGQRRFGLTAAAVVMLLLIGLLGFYVLYPILLIFLNSFNVARPGQPEVWGVQNWTQAFASPGIRTALWNTVWLFFAHQLLSFPLAILLAWTLHQGPHVLTIPGTGNPDHLAENVAAGALRLTEEELARLDAIHRGEASRQSGTNGFI